MKKHKHTIAVAVAVYLLISFVPSLSLTAILGGKGTPGGKRLG